MSSDIDPGTRLTGGFTVLESSARAYAVTWALKIAIACRCSQELRESMSEPAR